MDEPLRATLSEKAKNYKTKIEMTPIRTIQGISIFKIEDSLVDELSHRTHRIRRACPGFKSHTSLKEAEEFVKATMANKGDQKYLDTSKVGVQNSQTTIKVIEAVNQATVKKTLNSLVALKSRYVSTGMRAPNKLKELWSELSNGRSDISIDFFDQIRYPKQKSVILTIKGTEKPEEIVIVGGHLDSTSSNKNNAPGADDDASGLASISGVLDAIVKTGYKPKRTVQFIGYSAEEVGLVGSEEMAISYRKSGKKVVGVLQLDMTGFKYKGREGFNIVPDFSNLDLNNFIAKIHKKFDTDHIQIGKAYNKWPCGYACSDHASWHNEKFPAAHLWELETGNPKLHTPGDVVSGSNEHELSFQYITAFGKLAAAYVVELSDNASLLKK